MNATPPGAAGARRARDTAADLASAEQPDAVAAASATSFGQLLRRYRSAAGCTQEELAERSGYSTDYIGKLERDQRQPPLVAINRLATVLGVGDEERALLRAARTEHRRTQAAAHDRLAYRPFAPPPPGLLAQATSFIGREQEVTTVAALLLRDTVRLLTLTGPGGIGKTRLALQVAAAVAPSFPDGTFLVPLASLSDPDYVGAGVMTVLGLQETGGQSSAEAVTQYLRARQALLVLDNFEHVLPAASFVAALVAHCPQLRILVTSRAALRLTAERRYEVPPLPTPAPEWRGDLAALAGLDAVTLFVERARAVKDSFALTAANAQAVGAICRCLDGLPLALELAAARVRLFPPQALLERLSGRLALLAGGPKDHPARHQTLRATLDWSFNLLSPPEQVLFARLSIFAGGGTFQAVEAVCNPDGELDLLADLTSLVEKSLVRSEGEQEPRFSLLETIRDYAAEKLAERGERVALRDRHAEHFLELAQTLEPALMGRDQGEALALLDAELDNVRGALAWLLERGRSESALRLAGAMYWYWLVRGRCSEGRSWLEDGLQRAEGVAPAVHASTLWALGAIAVEHGENERATHLLEDALSRFRALGHDAGNARSLNRLGVAAWRQGKYERAVACDEEALRLATALGDRRERASALVNLGIVATHRGEYGKAQERLVEALALYRAQGDRHGVMHALINLGYDSTLRGNLSEARTMFEEVLETARDLRVKSHIAYALENLGNVCTLLGDLEWAASYLRESLILGRELNDQHLILYSLSDLTKLEAARRRPQRAACLGGLVVRLRALLGINMPLAEDQSREQAIDRARADLDEAGFRLAWESGQALNLDQAVAYALEHIER